MSYWVPPSSFRRTRLRGIGVLFAFALSGLASFALAAVNINTAGETELETLAGIGPVKAKAILDYRKKHGPFKKVDDLSKVRGIGQKTVNDLRTELTVK